jgi:hypothetical protein
MINRNFGAEMTAGGPEAALPARRRCGSIAGAGAETGMPQNSISYEDDFYGWTIEQSRLLRAGELSAIDAANIAEEIESMGRSDRRELKSRLVVLVMQLLKWRHQPGGPQLVGHDRRAAAADRRNPRRVAEPSAGCGGDAR